jgi:hypothetical protein
MKNGSAMDNATPVRSSWFEGKTAAHTTATNLWRMFLLAAQVEVVSNFIVARTPTSFKFAQFVSNFISVAAAQEIRKLLILLRWLCQTLLFVHTLKAQGYRLGLVHFQSGTLGRFNSAQR